MIKAIIQYCNYTKALLIACIAVLCASQANSIAIGDLISNTAQLEFQLTQSNQVFSADSNNVDITKVVKRTPATLEIQHVISANTPNNASLQAGCNGAGGFQSYNQIQHSGLPSGLVDLTSPLYLEDIRSLDGSEIEEDIGAFRVGEPVFIALTDIDQNINDALIETVIVTVESELGDIEEIVLYENGVNSGSFRGVIPTTRATTQLNNCILTVDTNQYFTVNYVDEEDSADVEAFSPLVDPYGVVYDTENGLPINSATVTIYRINPDGSTQVATVFADDGVTPWPSKVTTGQLIQIGNITEQFDDGGFRFPLVATGDYLIIVDSPALIDGPSSILRPDSQNINGNTYFPIDGGSYELPFSVPEGPPVRLDIPKDVLAGVSSNFSVSKKANTKYAAVGDFIQFTITAKNNHKTLPFNGVNIEDVLPVGMRYVKSSTNINGDNSSNPSIDPKGRVLNFDIGLIEANEEVTITYIAQIIASAPRGRLRNTAQVKTDLFESQLAYADIYITDELMQDTNQLIGRIIKYDCDSTEVADTLTNYDLLSLNSNEYTNSVKRAINELFSAIVSDASNNSSVRVIHYVQGSGGSALENNDIVENIGEDVYLTHYVQKDDIHDNENTLLALSTYLYKERGFELEQIEIRYNSALAQAQEKNIIVIEDQMDEFHYQKTLSYTVLSDSEIAKIENEKIKRRLADDIELKNIRLFLEDGRSTLTDGQGRYHFDNIDNKAHVLQVDKDSLVEGYELLLCEDDTRSANNPLSRFVDMSGGSLWRADFYIKRHVSDEDIADNALQPVAATQEVTSSDVLNETPKVLAPHWIESATGDFDLVSPLLEYSELPATTVIVKHPNKKGRKVELLVNGEEVNPVYRGKTLRNEDKSVAANTWSGIPINEGQNTIVTNYINSFGVTIDTKEKKLFYNNRITRVELVKEKSTLKADGKTTPIIAVRFTDSNGYPAHQDLQGKFDVEAPYQSRAEQQQDQKDLLLRESINNTFVIKEGGIAYIELEPTQQSGEVNLTFPIGERDEVIRAWLEPGLRDWILVGIAEGTVGYRTIKDNVEALDAHDKDADLYKDGRLAFYAKGKVKGKWLLTLAYDTDKEDKDKLSRELVDPALYFTLFADNTQTYQDARSKEKLYVKIEREKFYALFGDYSTGFTETNLANYNRRFNGLKSEYHGEKLAVKAFAAKEETQFIKDEIQGDGTSGAYQLSQKGIIINSESIKLETRDRFDETEVLRVNNLSRFIDYDIDYFEGKLIFKQPIFSRDENLDPIVIVADYETERLVDGDTSFGGRASYEFNDKVNVGLTAVNEARPSDTSKLVGVDVNVEIDKQNSLDIELAQTDSELAGSANSSLVGYRYNNDRISTNVAYKNYDTNFGLGQESVASQNFEQVSANVVAKLSKRLALKTQVIHQNNNDTKADSRRFSADLNYAFANINGVIGVKRVTTDDTITESSSTLMRLGVYKNMLNDKLRVGINSDFAVSSTQESKPQRYGLSLDYKLMNNIDVFYQHEFNRGDDDQDIQLLGLRTQPWKSAELSSYFSHEKDNTEAAYRTYSNYGLSQKLPINEKFSMNFGVDIAQELTNSHQQDSLASNFTAKDDYAALSIGSNYKEEYWSLNNQVEYRHSDSAKRWGLRVNWYRTLKLGYSYGARLQYFSNDNTQSQTNSQQARAEWSMAYRIFDSKWRVLERFEYVMDNEKGASSNEETDKLIHHIRANYRKGFNDEWSLGWSIKLNKQQFDEASYNSTSNFLTAEYSHDFKPWLDAGFHTSMLLFNGRAYSLGPNIGVSPYENLWITLGYNILGFSDSDFAAANYTEQGPWLSVRFKFDQDTIKKIRDKRRYENVGG